MRIILIDDHGCTKQIVDDDNKVMDAAKEMYFHPCGACGQVCYTEDAKNDQCKYCTGELESHGDNVKCYNEQ